MQNSKKGYFGDYGGSYVPPELQGVMDQIEKAFETCKNDPKFNQELDYYLRQYVGRPNPLYFAEKLTRKLGGAKIYLKREELNHTGAHKINNAIGQALIAKFMGKTRIIAETGAGQHGVATATACALFGLDCVIYMGEHDTRRQALNVFRMEILGAKVVAVNHGEGSMKEAIDEALEDLAQNYEDTFYLLGSAVGPHPYPTIVKHFQSIISKEAREQILEAEGRLPDAVLACVGGGSNAIGAFANFMEDSSVRLIGVEPAGLGLETGRHAAPLAAGEPGVIHGFRCYMMQDEAGNPLPTHSISAGLDYAGVGPEHSYLKDSGRGEYVAVTDQEALDAFYLLSRTEGIIPALESAHAVAYAAKIAPTLSPEKILIINVSGRGDKDVQQIFDMTR
ncbi:tryptophan synthase, beta subunit [Desulfitobacterium dichloroeliminans LMG P-21439]|uniref:Tryptophan synthase beta chain n=1 Tax=Desulfitobacterium dichloroeliminans (strain LMG P-21439 / DCA1) TaxID=871963 RepID=L0F1W4_DESDL|nr:tryptophan synthase subunit beta [Desulfitobacterium dichloroeliminans]AGA67849.1 tryptophan synthase, beta subunit [Desulfitobacterium dichloroeliminans LMG P-21439]